MTLPETLSGVNVMRQPAGMGIAFLCFLLVTLGAFAWVLIRPEAFLVGVPIFAVAAPLALVSMIMFFRRHALASAVWLIPIVFLMVDFNVRPGPASQVGTIDPQTLAKAVVYGILTIHGLAAFRFHSKSSAIIYAFIGYAVFAALSTIYADSKILAAGGGLALLGTAFSANSLSMLDEDAISRMWRNVLIGLAAFASVSLVLYFVLPGYAVAQRVSGAGRLQGVTGAPNSLGPLMVVGVLVGLYKLFGTARVWPRVILMSCIVMLLCALVLTGSRTAIGGLVITLAAMLMAGSALFLWFAIACTVLLAWAIAQPHLMHAGLRLLADLLSRSGQVFELTTFTGRIEIWYFSFQKWLDAPWLGYGLGGPRLVISQEWANRWGGTTGTAHNMLLESLMSVGAFGTVLLFSFALAVGIWVLREYRDATPRTAGRRLTWLLASLMIFIFIDGLMEKSFAGLPSPQTIILAMVAGTYLALRANRRKWEGNGR